MQIFLFKKSEATLLNLASYLLVKGRPTASINYLYKYKNNILIYQIIFNKDW